MPKGQNWTIDKVRQISKNYNSRTQFQNDHGSPYWWAKKNKLLNEIFPHLPPVTTRGYWNNKSNVISESKMRMDFKNNSRQAYNSALKNGWKEAFIHFENPKRNKSSKWQNKENVKKEALKYKTRTDFQDGSNSAWRAAKANGWEDIFAHMKLKVKPSGYWNSYKNCNIASLDCSSKMELRKRYRTAYETIKTNKWDELFSHMTDPRIGRQAHNISKEAKEKGWCLDTISPIAKKYNTRSQFEKERPSVYKEASRLGIMDQICSHMEVQGNHFKRAIYAIEFADGSVYVGLTYNFKERFNQHKRKSSNRLVREKIRSGIEYKFVMFKKFLSPDLALLEEKKIAQKYITKGFNLLNAAKLGGGASLGGGGKNLSIGDDKILHDIKWSKPLSLEAAKNCSSRTEFKIKYSGAWRHARHHSYIDECYKYLPSKKKPNGYWRIEENVINAAKKCKSRSEFKSRYGIAYRFARENGILNKLFPK